MITINLFYCCKMMFILINIPMIGKSSMKCSLPEKENSYSDLDMEEITDAYYAHAKKSFRRF